MNQFALVPLNKVLMGLHVVDADTDLVFLFLEDAKFPTKNSA